MDARSREWDSVGSETGIDGVVAVAVVLAIVIALMAGALGQLPLHSQWAGGPGEAVPETSETRAENRDSGIRASGVFEVR